MTVSDLRVLVENLDEYIHIPGGIERLKKTVLHLAVSGQLVAQDPSEGTGEELYKEIQSRHKPKNPLPEITKTPFGIPDSWKWVRFGMLGRFGSGSTPMRGENKYYDGGINWFKSGELTDSYMTDGSEETVTETALKECSLRMNRKGDILIAMYGATAGKLGLLEVDGTTNQAVCGVTAYEHVDRLFIYYWLLGTRDDLIAQSSGAAQPNISKIKIVNHYFALPPLNEQKRIVEKIEHTFALIDELDSNYKAEEVERSKLVKSSLRALSHNGSRLALDNLASTIKTKADAAELRKAILHLAVSGQLVPQIHREGTGKELYEQIQAELANGKRRKPLPEITEEEVPFNIPGSWTWARLRDISKSLSAGGDKPKDFTKEKAEQNTVPVIANGETNEGIIGFTKLARVTETSVTVSGRGTIGYSVVRDYPYTPIVRLLVITPPIGVLPQYIQFVFSSLFEGGLGTSIPQLTVPMITPKPVPLPPQQEQERIVQKTSELLELVTELERHMNGG